MAEPLEMSPELRRFLVERAVNLLRDCEAFDYEQRVEHGEWRVTVEKVKPKEAANG